MIDGVAINIGQRWKTVGSQVVDVAKFEASGNRWLVVCTDGKRWWVTNSGTYITPSYSELSECSDRQYDLDKIVGVVNALAADLPIQMFDDANTKATNPKEAIGDKKVPLWLCSPVAEAHWSAAQAAGLIKYGAWNWRAAGVRASTYLSAIKRHHARYANGERCDPVDGTHHLGNIMACCAILLEAEYIGNLNDDRGPQVDLQPLYDEVEAVVAKLKVQYADKAPKHWTINDELPS